VGVVALENDVSLYFILHRFPICCSHRCQHEVEVLFVDLCQVTSCPSNNGDPTWRHEDLTTEACLILHLPLCHSLCINEPGSSSGGYLIHSAAHCWSSRCLRVAQLSRLTAAMQKQIVSVSCPIILHLESLSQRWNLSACPPTRRHQHLMSFYRSKSGSC